jgi:hypothetical protein
MMGWWLLVPGAEQALFSIYPLRAAFTLQSSTKSSGTRLPVRVAGLKSAGTCDEITNFEAHIDVIGNACYSGICSGVRESGCGNGYRSVWKSVMNAAFFLLIYKSTNHLPGTLLGLTVDTFNPVAIGLNNE